jgi:hypothetical protein
MYFRNYFIIIGIIFTAIINGQEYHPFMDIDIDTSKIEINISQLDSSITNSNVVTSTDGFAICVNYISATDNSCIVSICEPHDLYSHRIGLTRTYTETSSSMQTDSISFPTILEEELLFLSQNNILTEKQDGIISEMASDIQATFLANTATVNRKSAYHLGNGLTYGQFISSTILPDLEELGISSGVTSTLFQFNKKFLSVSSIESIEILDVLNLEGQSVPYTMETQKSNFAIFTKGRILIYRIDGNKMSQLIPYTE